jgi:hypothetical protein
MATLKSAQHHWWPQCVSQHWAGSDGKTGWIRHDGTVRRIPPHRLGMIGNAHHIKLGAAGETTPWDSSFEKEFEAADTNFPAVILWLESLVRVKNTGGMLRERFTHFSATDEQLRSLTESVVSLAVRSPRNREASVALAERLRGPLPARERETLIGANMARSQRVVADAIGTSAKFAVLFSESAEFIFGDGFFHNVTAAVNPPHYPKILAPITPHISVVVVRPMEYLVEPRLCSIVLTDSEVGLCNHAVQVYSRNALFFRSQQPVIDQAFQAGQHLGYARPENPIDQLIQQIPGVALRNRYVDGPVSQDPE